MDNPELKPHSFSELFLLGVSRSQFLTVVVKAVGVASSLFVLAVLSVHEFGLYQLILSAVAIAASFTTGLFNDVITNDIARSLFEKRIASAKRLFQEFFALRFTIGVAASAVLFFGADLVAHRYGQDIGSYIRIASVLVAIGSVRTAEAFFFQAKISFAAYGAGALQEVLRLAFLGAFWFFGTLGLRGVLIANVLAAGAVLGYTSFFFVREYRSLFGSVVAEKGILLLGIVRRYGRWVFLRYGFSTAFKQTDVWFIRLFLNTEAVALYSLAFNLVALAQDLIPTGILGTLLPREVPNDRRFRYIYCRMLKYSFWGGAVVAAGALIFVPQIVSVFYPKYLPAMPLFRLMLITLPLYAVYKAQKTFLIVLREQKILTMRLLTEALVTSAILVVLLPLMGLYAAVVEYLVTYAGRVALYSFYLGRRYAHLVLKPAQFFSFDRDDWEYLNRAVRELAHPSRWLRPIRTRVEI